MLTHTFVGVWKRKTFARENGQLVQPLLVLVFGPRPVPASPSPSSLPELDKGHRREPRKLGRHAPSAVKTGLEKAAESNLDES